jgi:hypothetical protein
VNVKMKKTREEMVNRLKYINSVINSPESYHADVLMLKELEAEQKKLMEEYQKLPPKEYIKEIELVKKVTYEGHNYSIRDYGGKLHLFSASESISKDVKQIDENTFEASRLMYDPRQVAYIKIVYKIRVVPEAVKPEAKPLPKPCSKEKEIESAVTGNKGIDYLMGTWKCPLCHAEIMNKFDLCQSCAVGLKPKEENLDKTDKKPKRIN